jgi:hypothetical protein
MPLHRIMSAMEKPVKPEVTKAIIRYMKGMPSDHEALILQCAEQLDKDQSLGTVLAVVHALNEGEFLLKCRDDEDDMLLTESELSKEFDKLMGDHCPTHQSNSRPIVVKTDEVESECEDIPGTKD